MLLVVIAVRVLGIFQATPGFNVPVSWVHIRIKSQACLSTFHLNRLDDISYCKSRAMQRSRTLEHGIGPSQLLKIGQKKERKSERARLITSRQGRKVVNINFDTVAKRTCWYVHIVIPKQRKNGTRKNHTTHAWNHRVALSCPVCALFCNGMLGEYK